MQPVDLYSFATYFGACAPGRDDALAKLDALIQKHDANAVTTNRPSGPELPCKHVFPKYQPNLKFGWGEVCQALGITDGYKITMRPVPFDAVRDVPTDELIATQPVVKANVIKGAINKPLAVWSKQETPLFVYKDNKYYVFDGHHRVAAAILLGLSHVTGQVVDLT